MRPQSFCTFCCNICRPVSWLLRRDMRKVTMGSSLRGQWLGLHTFTAMALGSIPGQGIKICKPRGVTKKKKVTKNKIQKSLSNSSYCLVCSKVFYCNSFEIEAANVSKWQTVESQYFLLFKKKPTLLY